MSNPTPSGYLQGWADGREAAAQEVERRGSHAVETRNQDIRNPRTDAPVPKTARSKAVTAALDNWTIIVAQSLRALPLPPDPPRPPAEPVAWEMRCVGDETRMPLVTNFKLEADQWIEEFGAECVVPLYAAPPPPTEDALRVAAQRWVTLCDEFNAMVESHADADDTLRKGDECQEAAHAIRLALTPTPGEKE